ncbi:MAG: patatin-like phospholipase family protein [Chloroflexi bacterium]|nr:patatin-like phospholipase family protein [Chloroflexota bacterium]
MGDHFKQEKKLGLSLSGGGARGLAHIGVLKVLETEGIKISSISGCSMGGLIGALFAIGISIQQIEAFAIENTSIREMIRLVGLAPSRRGLIEGQKIRKLLSKIIREDTDFLDLKIPLTLNAVDINSGKEIALTEGNLLDAIMATTAVPGFFEPVLIEGFYLIDGGVLDNLPIKFLQNKNLDIIVGVDVHQDLLNDLPIRNLTESKLDFFQNLYRSETIMISEITKFNLEKFSPDVLIKPSIPRGVTMFRGFQKAAETINCGVISTNKQIEQIKDKLI